MLKTHSYLFGVLLLAASLLACNSNNNLPSLKETFSKNDKIPFGSFVMFQQIRQMFYLNNIRVKKEGFEKSLQGNTDTGALYINISKNFFLTNNAAAALLTYVANGNKVFIGSENIDTVLLVALGIKASQAFIFANPGQPFQHTSVLLHPAAFSDTNAFTYFYYPFANQFSVFNKSTSLVLGTNQNGAPNYLVVFYGKGRFYLHCEPRALSNYFLLQKENYQYLQQLFSFMPAIPEYVFWDDYYNKINFRPADTEAGNSLAVLLRYPPMAWAFWLLLSLLLLYIVFGGKRRQRIVPAIAPNENTTVAFTETISRLYFQNKDNKDIADKMIAYFFEHIRNQYFLNTNHLSEEFAATLSRKANVNEELIDKLFNSIVDIQQAENITDDQLLSLNKQIEQFYKNRK